MEDSQKDLRNFLLSVAAICLIFLLIIAQDLQGWFYLLVISGLIAYPVECKRRYLSLFLITCFACLFLSGLAYYSFELWDQWTYEKYRGPFIYQYHYFMFNLFYDMHFNPISLFTYVMVISLIYNLWKKFSKKFDLSLFISISAMLGLIFFELGGRWDRWRGDYRAIQITIIFWGIAFGESLFSLLRRSFIAGGTAFFLSLCLFLKIYLNAMEHNYYRGFWKVWGLHW